MALRDWTPRRIKRIWAVGMGIEMLLIGWWAVFAWMAIRDRDRAIDSARRPVPERTAPQREAELHRMAARSGGSIFSSGDSLMVIRFSDSATQTLHFRGDTIVAMELSPAAQHGLDRSMRGLGEGLKNLGRDIMIVLALIYLPIPTALLMLTAAWWTSRRLAALGAKGPRARSPGLP
jgi:hypothetical protein